MIVDLKATAWLYFIYLQDDVHHNKNFVWSVFQNKMLGAIYLMYNLIDSKMS